MPDSPPAPETTLLPAALRAELSRRFPVRPAVYWADLLGSAALGWGLFVGSAVLAPSSPLYWVLSLACALAFLRAGFFIHELRHRRREELPGLHLAWDLLVGIPVLLPSLMMWPHEDHHRLASYGTARDPEYAPVPRWSRTRLLGAVGLYVTVPWLMAIRWGFTAPVSRLHPRLRRHALEKFSTADIHHEYVRPPIPEHERGPFLRLEAACMLFTWGAIGLTVAGVLPWWIHLHRALVMAVALVLNHMRLMVIHRYAGDGEPMSLRAQGEDTVTLGPDSPLTELVAPVGSRFHALHHELPAVPYHALPAIHRELVATLSADHPYRATIEPGFFRAWAALWRRAATAAG